jgi:hypothetical protein
VAVRLRKKKGSARSRKVLEAWIPSDPTCPHYMEVRNAFIETFANWYACTTDTEHLDEAKRLEKQWNRLAPLLSRYPPTTRNHDWRDLPTQPQIVRVMRHALRVTADHASKGRPRSDLRRLAVQALDLRHRDLKRWTWHELAVHFDIYKCTKEAGHDPGCQKKWQDYRECQKRRENDLRRQALYVKESLRELGVRLPTQRNSR